MAQTIFTPEEIAGFPQGPAGPNAPGVRCVSANGDDGNDGRSWDASMKTPQAAVASIMAADGIGLVLLAPGIYNLADTLMLPQGVGLAGLGHALGGQGAHLVWAGPDDGRPAVRLANDVSGSDWSGGTLRNVRILCGSGYTAARGLYARNLQNGALIEDVFVKGFPSDGVYADASNGVTPLSAFPGFATFRRVWSSSNGINWHMYGGFTSILLDMCAGEVAANTTDVFVIDPPAAALGGHGGTYTLLGFKTEDGGSGAPAPRYFTINCDIQIALIGCCARKGTPGPMPWIDYRADASSGNDPLETEAIPLTLVNCHTSNLAIAVRGPGGVPLLVPRVPNGGTIFRIPFWAGWVA